MKFLFSGVLFIIVLSAGIQAQSRLELKSERVENDLLAKILNLSEMREIKPLRPVDSKFVLRLYSLDAISNNEADPDEEGLLEHCAPEIDTEVVCSFRYFLAVHSGDLGFSGKVYDLGMVGEITKIEWQKKSSSDSDRLRVEVTNYPADVLRFNPKLVKRTKKFELIIKFDSLEIKELK